MQKTTHTAGTKSFARHAHEMQMNDPDKREPNRAAVYLVTHRHQDGTFVNEEIASAIQKQMEEHPESASNLDGRVAWEGDALSQVLGKDKNGCVQGLGLLPDPKKVLQPTRHFEGMDITTLDEKMLVILVHDLIGKLEKLEIRVEELEKQGSHQHGVPFPVTSNSSGNGSRNGSLSPPSPTLPHNEQCGFTGLLNSNGANWELPDY